MKTEKFLLLSFALLCSSGFMLGSDPLKTLDGHDNQALFYYKTSGPADAKFKDTILFQNQQFTNCTNEITNLKTQMTKLETEKNVLEEENTRLGTENSGYVLNLKTIFGFKTDNLPTDWQKQLVLKSVLEAEKEKNKNLAEEKLNFQKLNFRLKKHNKILLAGLTEKVVDKKCHEKLQKKYNDLTGAYKEMGKNVTTMVGGLQELHNNFIKNYPCDDEDPETVLASLLDDQEEEGEE